jgi:HEPN domain-containing protein
LLDEVGDRPGISDAIYGFHAQQASEKLLKALLSQHGVHFPRTHDLTELVGLLATVGQQLPDTLCNLDELTPFAVEFRYGDGLPGKPLERAAVRARIRALRRFVETQMQS